MHPLSSLRYALTNDARSYWLVVGVSIAGEWWHADVEAVEKQGRMLGMAPNMSDAHTINGKPGPLFPCSEKRAWECCL